MTDPVRTPKPEYPLAIAPHEGRVTVRFDGVTIADTDRALAVREADYALVYYVPREDVDLDALLPSEHRKIDPFKGEATFYTIVGENERGVNAAWSYENPLPEAAPLARHLVFDTNVVEVVAAPESGATNGDRTAG